MDLKIYLTTLGRVHRQILLRQLPSDLARESVYIVCPPDEARSFKDLFPGVTVLPEPSNTLAPRRQWCLEHAKKRGHKRVVLADDDVTIQVRRSDMKITNATAAECTDAFKWLDVKLREYAHASLAPRTMDFMNRDVETYAKRAMYLLGFDVRKFHAAGVRFGLPVPKASMSDFHSTLQLLRAGHLNVLSLEYRTTPRDSAAKGGCQTYRTAETIAASARALAKLHAPFVKLREKKAWSAIGESVQLDVTVQWQQAAKAGGAL